ncbi:hypothetical protein [Pseudoxanthomonas kalamensis]|uniref:hypothetical protein n=1 Tax=Pseudoxanthomonas kalamensis TaxID=289483 RepID=UPI0013907B6F|nr:hypothetical protein [Pseudoxanthomonas kalamensis]
MATANKNKSSKSFSGAKGGKSGPTVTSERIEQDIAEFEKSGGKIEKLGNTNTFKKLR